MYKLPQLAVEQIKYYVYLLKDPLTHKVFYVGKGKSQRLFSHEKEIQSLGKKIEKIREIKNRKTNNEVEYQILRHGLTKDEAYIVESSAIDLLGLDQLTNKVKGHNSDEYGITNIDEFIIKYTAKEVKIDMPVAVFILNNTFKIGMKSSQIYDITRKSWKISKGKRDKYKYAFATYKGIIREIFVIDSWRKCRDSNRYEFIGNVCKDNIIRKKYMKGSIRNYIKRGNQSPIRFFN